MLAWVVVLCSSFLVRALIGLLIGVADHRTRGLFDHVERQAGNQLLNESLCRQSFAKTALLHLIFTLALIAERLLIHNQLILNCAV